MDEAESRLLLSMTKLIGLRMLVEHAIDVEPYLTMDDIFELTTHMKERKEDLEECVNNYYKLLLKRLTEGEP